MIQYRNIGYASVLAVAALALAGGQAMAQEKASNGQNAICLRGLSMRMTL